MRVVLDTNVIVSGLLTESGPPAQVVDLYLAGDLELLVDDRILAEYRAVLRRGQLSLDQSDVAAFLEVAERAEHCVGAPLPFALPDASDEPFLEVAIAGGADALVTGNAKHFRPPKGRLAIPVVSPRQALDLFAGR